MLLLHCVTEHRTYFVTGESLLDDLAEVALERAKESRADDAETLARQIAVAAAHKADRRLRSGESGGACGRHGLAGGCRVLVALPAVPRADAAPCLAATVHGGGIRPIGGASAPGRGTLAGTTAVTRLAARSLSRSARLGLT